jgi:hypothetical protein
MGDPIEMDPGSDAFLKALRAWQDDYDPTVARFKKLEAAFDPAAGADQQKLATAAKRCRMLVLDIHSRIHVHLGRGGTADKADEGRRVAEVEEVMERIAIRKQHLVSMQKLFKTASSDVKKTVAELIASHDKAAKLTRTSIQ